jgi:hypothetical protein
VFALPVAVVAAAGCHGPENAFARADAGGPPPPVEQAIVDDRVARYVDVGDRIGTERCRCAGDYELCRLELDADWDAAGRECLGDVIRLDVNGTTDAVTCLESEVPTFEACHSALPCTSAEARQNCMQSWIYAASTCVMTMTNAAQVALAVCSPTTPDAGP